MLNVEAENYHSFNCGIVSVFKVWGIVGAYKDLCRGEKFVRVAVKKAGGKFIAACQQFECVGVEPSIFRCLLDKGYKFTFQFCNFRCRAV